MNIRTTCTTKEIHDVNKRFPGAQFIGMFSDPRVNRGQEIPMIQASTEEAFYRAVNNVNCRTFRTRFGRDPVSDEELNTWVHNIKREDQHEG